MPHAVDETHAALAKEGLHPVPAIDDRADQPLGRRRGHPGVGPRRVGRVGRSRIFGHGRVTAIVCCYTIFEHESAAEATCLRPKHRLGRREPGAGEQRQGR